MLTVTEEKPLSHKALFDSMVDFENVLSQMEGAEFGDAAAPLRHTFGDGIYIREITMPGGMVLTSKIHKTTHPYFILKGELSVLTEDGMKRIKAPYWGMTKAGTKRVIHIHKETVWCTVHATKETDLEKIEDELIAKDYNALPRHVRLRIEGKSQ